MGAAAPPTVARERPEALTVRERISSWGSSEPSSTRTASPPASSAISTAG